MEYGVWGVGYGVVSNIPFPSHHSEFNSTNPSQASLARQTTIIEPIMEFALKSV
jgi:hypothetical protein